MPTDATTAATSAVHTGHTPTEQPGGDAGERDVPDAVTHKRQALLHEERTDERRGRADDHGREQRQLHVLAVERIRQAGQAAITAGPPATPAGRGGARPG